MGIQSLDDDILAGVHRRHTADRALEACRLIVDHGLILNVDLMYGLPGQSEDSFQRDLEVIAKAGVPSLTLYNLRVNEATPVVNKLGETEKLDMVRLMRWASLCSRDSSRVGFYTDALAHVQTTGWDRQAS